MTVIAGTCVGHAHKVTAIAYADDITVIINKIKKQTERDAFTNHLILNENASSSKTKSHQNRSLDQSRE